jgi:hypothetical protein
MARATIPRTCDHDETAAHREAALCAGRLSITLIATTVPQPGSVLITSWQVPSTH